MSMNAMVVGWDRPVPGHEAQASERFSAFVGYLTEQQQKGQIQSFEPVLLLQHGGHLNGFFLVRGETTKLAAMKADDRFLDLTTHVLFHVQGFTILDAFSGDAVMARMGRWRQFIGK
jgi:hypothetical protein